MREIYREYTDIPLTLSAPQVAEVLGISRNCAYELFRRSDFPTIQIGKRKLVARSHLLNWIDRNSQAVERTA